MNKTSEHTKPPYLNKFVEILQDWLFPLVFPTVMQTKLKLLIL